MQAHEQIPLATLADRLGDAPLAFRGLVRDWPEGLSLSHFVADQLPLPNLEMSKQDYGDAVFVLGTVPGSRLIEWLTAGAGELAGVSFAVQLPQDLVSHQREPAFGPGNPLPLPWPTSRFEIHPRDSARLQMATQRWGF